MPSHNQGYPITIDGVASSTIPEYLCQKIKREIVGERRHEIKLIPGVAGGLLVPQQPGMKKITLESALIADSFPVARRDAARAIALWVDKLTWVKMVCGDEPDFFNWVILDNTPETDEWREIGEFTLEFLAQPYGISNTISTDTHTAGSESDTVALNTVTGEIKTYPVIELTSSGTTTATIVTLNGRTLTYSTQIDDGESITIDCIAKVVQEGTITDTDVVGDFDAAALSMGGVSGQFPWLEVGANSIDIEMTGSSGWDLDIRWRSRYQ